MTIGFLWFQAVALFVFALWMAYRTVFVQSPVGLTDKVLPVILASLGWLCVAAAELLARSAR